MTEPGNISVRALNADDLPAFKDMRLKALKSHPGLFMSSYEDSVKHPESYWQETLDGRGKQVFGLFDHEKLVGITAVFTWREDPEQQTGILAMSYIEPSYRGRGFSRLFYKARINWALTQPQLKRLIVSHREGNEPSKRAILKHGFTYVEEKTASWPDGLCACEHDYEMDLEALRAEKAT